MPPLLPVLTSLLLLGQLQAAEPASSRIYQWTNQDGQVQFSDRPPPNGIAPDKVISASKPASQAPGNDNNAYSIENQARRMEADRKQREENRWRAERKRWERRQLEIEEQKRIAELKAAEAQALREQDAVYRPVYPGYGYPIYHRRGGGHHRPVRPVHPIQPVAPWQRPTPRTHINAPFRAGARPTAPR